MKKISSFLILAAGILWGTMPVFVRALSGYGFTPIQISCLRLLSAGLMLFLLAAPKGRWKIRLRDLPMLAALGFVSVLLMTWSYFSAITHATANVAAVLLYTAPVLVMLMSAVLFREKITVRKVMALACAFGGCVLVSGIAGGMHTTTAGFLYGLTSGVAYALYSILALFALRKNHPFTVTAYAFTLAGLGAMALCRFSGVARIFAVCETPVRLWTLTLATGLVTAAAPYALYTLGLRETPAGQAAVLASVEPMTATLAGVLFFHEEPGVTGWLGVVMILAAIAILNPLGKRSGRGTAEKHTETE